MADFTTALSFIGNPSSTTPEYQGPSIVERWRVASGNTPGDTATLTTKWIKKILAVHGTVGNNISTSTTNSCTLTLLGDTAATQVATDILVIGFPR